MTLCQVHKDLLSGKSLGPCFPALSLLVMKSRWKFLACELGGNCEIREIQRNKSASQVLWGHRHYQRGCGEGSPFCRRQRSFPTACVLHDTVVGRWVVLLWKEIGSLTALNCSTILAFGKASRPLLPCFLLAHTHHRFSLPVLCHSHYRICCLDVSLPELPEVWGSSPSFLPPTLSETSIQSAPFWSAKENI